MMDTTATRRALIGVMIAAPVLAAPALASTAEFNRHRAQWDRTMQAFQEATKAANEFGCAVYDPSYKRMNALHPRPERGAMSSAWDHWFKERAQLAATTGHDHIADEYDRLGNEAATYRETLLEMPAPDRAALLWKLEELFGTGSGRKPDDEGGAFCCEWVEAYMADARRLLGEEMA